MNWLGRRVNYLINNVDAKSMLDVGCGLANPTKEIKVDFKVGVDVYKEYLNYVSEDMITICCDARNIGNLFKPKSFDAVLCLDMIEHLEKDEGFKLKEDLEKICSKLIVFYTTNGFLKQELNDGKDAWGFDNEAQVHRSGFLHDDFSGYCIEVYKNGGTFLAWKTI